MKLYHPIAIALLLLASSSTLPAQGPLFTTDRLIGWAAPPSSSTTGQIDIQTIINPCPPAGTVCKPIFGKPEFKYSGGTAYDPRHQSVWVSDGFVLAEFKVRGCQGLCKQVPTLIGGTQSTVSGLAISDRHSLLFQLETYPGNLGIVTYNNKNCPPQAISKCQFPIGPQDIAAGLAYDEARDLLYYTISQPTAIGTWNTTLMVAPANNPCNPVCKWLLPQNCTRQLITGLAYNACRGELYATDGQITQVVRVINPLNCQFKASHCCKKGLAGDWKGLCFVPGWTRVNVSKSCSKLPCQNCPNMVSNLTGGDTSLGNPDFGFTLTGAPTGSTGILLVKPGSCGPPLNIPFLCGPLYAFPAGLIQAVTLGGTGTCGGSANVNLPLPPTTIICGAKLCAQWLVFCTGGGGIGFGVSNAIEFTIASS